MKQFIKNIIFITGLASFLLAPIVLVPATGYAACDDTISVSTGAKCAKSDDQKSNLFGNGGIFKTITNVLLFIIGAVSVIMLIIGGFRYVISQGDSTQITAAKNTILYSVIGIIVALLAYAIVNFVVTQFIKG